LLKAVAKAEAEERQREGQRQAQVAITAPRSGFVRFVDRCNAFYRDPANARLSMSDARQLFRCSRMTRITRMRDLSARAQVLREKFKFLLSDFDQVR
jgi:hypothetical protein